MPGKQQEKSRQTKQELMQAAFSLFEQKGFYSTSISEITGQAGYAKGNFYRHWASKNDLFLDIMAARLKHYRSKRDPELQKAGDIEEVAEIIISFLENMIDDKTWYKVFLEFTVHSFDDDRIKKALNDSRYRLSSSLFARLFSPFVADYASTQKLGAQVTALFEGFLIHQALESNVLSKEDLRKAILTLARSYLPEMDKTGGR